ncbi:hypothetical protein M885DRAFT_623031 [Pelagophyceae sp. CCMP2097]|nr:hypothetical protein M885DRAFT_623031 [Pelagophyceae sp. CCMP2097]
MDLFDALPHAGALVSCLGLQCRMRLMLASLRAKQAVCGAPCCWTTISFDADCAAKLSDAQLAALLRRVSAVEKTRSLSIKGCLSVTGAGLVQLRTSTVLETLDLRVSPFTDAPLKVKGSLDAALICAFLMNKMLPVQPSEDRGQVLENVMLQPTRRSRRLLKQHDRPWRALLARVFESRAYRRRRDRTACGHCTDAKAAVLADVGNANEDSFWPLSRLSCHKCTKFTCGGFPGRYDCPLLKECTSCSRGICETCADADEQECRRCAVLVCGDCVRSGGDLPLLVHCSICRRDFCYDCKETGSCPTCHENFCSDCFPASCPKCS